MLSKKPYLLQAHYDWIVDSHCTPYLVIYTTHPGVEVPAEFSDESEIILNISPRAVQNFRITKKQVTFNACFDQTPAEVVAPIDAVLAIYPKEEPAEGFALELEETVEPVLDPLSSNAIPAADEETDKPYLTIVEDD